MWSGAAAVNLLQGYTFRGGIQRSLVISFSFSSDITLHVYTCDFFFLDMSSISGDFCVNPSDGCV